MFKTIKNFIMLMGTVKQELYVSLLLSGIDGFILTVPILAAYTIVSRIPELNTACTEPLTAADVIRYSVIMIACVILRIVMRYYVQRLRSGAGYKVMCKERKILGKELRSVPMGFFNEKNLGDLVSTVTSDAAFIEIEGAGVLEKAAVGLPSFIIGLGILLYMDYRIFFATLLLLIPVWFSYKHFASLQDRLGINRQQFIGSVTEDAVEFIKGLHVLKTCNMAEKQFFKTQNAFKRLQEFSFNAELVHIKAGTVFQFCFRLVTAAIVILSAFFVLHGEYSFPKAFLLMISSFSLFAGAETMGIFSVFAKMTQQSIDRINQIKTIPKMQDMSGRQTLSRFDIQFKDVTFAYETKPVLKHIDFTVKENTLTALVGLSGSGKTTVTNLIARFWDIREGEILIGGKKIKELSYENLLKNIGFVFQDVFLFDDTVMNNIRIGRPEASAEEVYQAAYRAGCTGFIEKMEKGYDTVIGEAGVKLSGGEKQRLSIARALIKNTPIVLLDEVTANVDADNEVHIQKALQELLKDRTVIMIAHKLSSIQHADQVLVFESGSIIQRGTHAELIGKDGLYKRLWDMQYRTTSWHV
ncbi:ABC transporter ATP-binding protein [Treponema pedis]|uniref:ABC transporter ATP-binding protein n=1 Tax=Treponema pedis TaxID=409322 RepID=UPI0003FB1FBB|nr:ABC transporter ATP-binding protein [Treponema pedis]